MKCKCCGNELTQEMIDANLCWTCGDIINENIFKLNDTLSEDSNEKCGYIIEDQGINEQQNTIKNKNIIGVALRILGIMVLIFGTIGSLVLANAGGRYSSFSVSVFVIYEFATILSAFLLLGISEIIQLLYHISKKIK